MSVLKNLLTLKLLFLCMGCWLLTISASSQSVNDSLKLSDDSLSVSADTLGRDSLKASTGDDIKSKVHYTALDTIDFDVVNEKVFMYEKAQVNYETIELKAAYIEVDWNSKNVFSSGLRDSSGKVYDKPVFKEKSEEFNADTMRYNFDSKKGKIYNINTRDGEGYIHGEVVKKVDESSYIKFGRYTTCDLDTPHYYIASNRLKVIPNNKIITGPAFLYIEDVPTPAVVPFGLFPNKKGRSSGIVFPAYGESGQLGFFFKNGGYYFGISDHVDLKLTGDIYTMGSWATRAESRYANRYHYTGNFAFSYSIITQSERELPDYSRSRLFNITWNHSQDKAARPNSIFSARVNAGSNDYYTKAQTTSRSVLNNTLSSSISYSTSFFNKTLNLSSAITHNQNNQSRDVNLDAPSLSLSLVTQYPFKKKDSEGTPKWYEKIGVGYSSTLQNHLNNKDTVFFTDNTVRKMQNGMQHNIPISTSFKVFKYFTLSPSVNFTERWYLRTYRKRYVTDVDTILTDTVNRFNAAHDYSGNLSLNTRMYGMLQFKRGKIAAIRHVMTPTFSYSYRPDFAKGVYGYYKPVQYNAEGDIKQYSIYEGTLYGGPGQGRSSVIGFNLDNNLEMKVRPPSSDTSTTLKKIKIFESLSLNTSYNLLADSFNLSPIGIAARTTLFDRVNWQATGTLDPYVVTSSGRNKEYLISKHNQLARLTNLNTTLSFSLSPKAKSKPKESNKGTSLELNEINSRPENYVDFTIPYNLSINYSIAYSRPALDKANINQTLGFNGDISLTENWKVTFNSGYDFENHDFSYTSLGFYRNLHCWEMNLQWVPFGTYANYFFQINVKSSILQDLKLTKKTDSYD